MSLMARKNPVERGPAGGCFLKFRALWAAAVALLLSFGSTIGSVFQKKWKRVAALAISVILAAPVVIVFSWGRYCDDRIGALGHPYYRFANGSLELVACGQHIPQGTFQRTRHGWVCLTSEHGVTTAKTLRFALWSFTAGQPPDQLKVGRCWHFWMNSHGPLWHPWDQ